MNWELMTFALSTALAIISIVFVGFQIKNNTDLKRTEYVEEISESVHFDERITEVIYLLEYEESNWYNDDFHDSDLEVKVDAALSRYDFICYLEHKKILKKDEMVIYNYELKMILRNDSMQQYLLFLCNWCAKVMDDTKERVDQKKSDIIPKSFTEIFPFWYLLKKGIDMGYIQESWIIEIINKRL